MKMSSENTYHEKNKIKVKTVCMNYLLNKEQIIAKQNQEEIMKIKNIRKIVTEIIRKK